MNLDDIKKLIIETVNQKMSAMTNFAIPFHTHNKWDSPQLDPATALIGFPVTLVSNAATAPTDTPNGGTIRFFVDSVPNYRMWVFFAYQNGSTTTGTWKSVALT